MDNVTKMTSMFDRLYIFVEKNNLGKEFEKLMNFYDYYYIEKEEPK